MSTPAGWYPDPADPSHARWWDGRNWTDRTAPTAAVASPGEPVPAPRFGEYAPVPPVASAPVQEAASVTYPAWPAAAPPVAQTAPQTQGLDTGTPWVWLSILAAHLPIVLVFLIDWQGYIDAVIAMETGSDPAAAAAAMAEWTASIMGISLFSYVFMAAAIVFAWLDYRALVARGIQKPFHWAFAFLTLVITIGVYIIGRTVIVKRQTGKGLGPLWGWIAATLLVIAISIGFTVSIVTQAIDTLPV